MRKFKSILAIIITILFLDHQLFGGTAFGNLNVRIPKPLAFLMGGLIILHAIISLTVTWRAEKAGFKTNARYNAENRQFWNRRVSGVLILLLIPFHAFMLRNGVAGLDTTLKLVLASLSAVLLSLSVFWHLIQNIKPLLISLGFRPTDTKILIIRIILALLCLYTSFSIVRSFIAGGAA
ncbi:MAG: hypothetical protein J6Z03_09355 [Erysipelotrichaceae bacterium]|nr:hypothetical protein [Erysipelotrichaceae bacterium]